MNYQNFVQIFLKCLYLENQTTKEALISKLLSSKISRTSYEMCSQLFQLKLPEVATQRKSVLREKQLFALYCFYLLTLCNFILSHSSAPEGLILGSRLSL